MASGSEPREGSGGVGHGAVALVRFLGSLKLTGVLLLLLGGAVGIGAYLESARGLEFAQWYVFDRAWYVGLLGALAVNVAVAALIRWPGSWSRRALLLAPLGMVLVLAGGIETLVQGIEGRLLLWKGASTQDVLMTHRSQLTLLSPSGQEVHAAELVFSPGPLDWRNDQPLDFGEVNGRRIKVLQFARHTRYDRTFVPDETGAGKPAILVRVVDPANPRLGEAWCLPLVFGALTEQGSLSIEIEQAAVGSFRDDFIDPPAVAPASRGIISVHEGGHVYRFPVDGNTGKKLPLGDSGLSVEIVDSFANAISEKDRFHSDGEEPKNPMLLLRVYPPGKTPITEIAYANQPFVNYESIKKQSCPVKFWYHHPAVKLGTGAGFLQMPDGTLYYRSSDSGVVRARGKIKPGDTIELSGNRSITLLEHIPHARPESIFISIKPAPGERLTSEAAAQIEVSGAGKSEQFWLRRNDAQLGVRNLQPPLGPLLITFGYERRPLGFSVRLDDFRRSGKTDTLGVSQVVLSRATQGQETSLAALPPRELAANRPIRYGPFTLEQAGSAQIPGKLELSILRVTSDPGRYLRYAGGVLIVIGVLYWLWLRTLGRRPVTATTPEAAPV